MVSVLAAGSGMRIVVVLGEVAERRRRQYWPAHDYWRECGNASSPSTHPAELGDGTGQLTAARCASWPSSSYSRGSQPIIPGISDTRMRLVVVAALRFVCFAGVLLTAAATSSSARHPSPRRFATDKAQSDSGYHSYEQSHRLSLITGGMLDASWREATKMKRALRGHTKDHAVSHRRQLSNATAAAVVALSVEKDGGADRRHNVIVIDGTNARQIRVQRVEHKHNMTVIIAENVYQDHPTPHTRRHRRRHHHHQRRRHNFLPHSVVDVRDGSIFARYNGSVHGHNITEAMVRAHELRMRRARDRRNETEHAYFVRWADLAHNATMTRTHNTSPSYSTTGTSALSDAHHMTITGIHNSTSLYSVTGDNSFSNGTGRGAQLVGAGREGSGAPSDGTVLEGKREVFHGMNRVEAVGGGLSVDGFGRGKVGEVGGGERTSHTLARITRTAEAQADGTHAHAARNAADATRHTNGSLISKGVMDSRASGGVAGEEGRTTSEFGLNGTLAAQSAAAAASSSTDSSLLAFAREVGNEGEGESRGKLPVDAQAGMRAQLDRRSDEVGRDGQRHDQSARLEVGVKGEGEKDTRRGHDHGSRSRGQPHGRDGQSPFAAVGSGFGGVGDDAEDHLISTVEGAEARARVYERGYKHEPHSPIERHRYQKEGHHSGDDDGDRRDDEGGNDHGDYLGGEDARRWHEGVHEGSVRTNEAVEAEAGGLSDAHARRERHHHPHHEAQGDGHRHSYESHNDDGRARRAFRLRGSGDRGRDGALRVDDEEDDEQPEARDRQERTSAVPSGDDHALQEYEETSGDDMTEENGGISDTPDAGVSSKEKVMKKKTPLFDWGALLKGLRVGMGRNGSMWVGSAQQGAEKQKQQLQQQRQQQQQKGGKAGNLGLFGLWGAIS